MCPCQSQGSRGDEFFVDITGLLPITPMENKSNEKGRPFMTELLVSFSSSQHSYHTLGKKGIVKG